MGIVSLIRPKPFQTLKHQGNGQARVLTKDELDILFDELKRNPRDAALFAICLYTGCRISEALQLTTADVKPTYIVFRKSITKGKLKSRTVPVHPELADYLAFYWPKKPGFLFPGQRGRRENLSRNQADRILRNACKRANLTGVSTHSFRRTALTIMCKNGVPMRHIQEISGHADLGTLQRYLEVSDDDRWLAILSMQFKQE